MPRINRQWPPPTQISYIYCDNNDFNEAGNNNRNNNNNNRRIMHPCCRKEAGMGPTPVSGPQCPRLPQVAPTSTTRTPSKTTQQQHYISYIKLIYCCHNNIIASKKWNYLDWIIDKIVQSFTICFYTVYYINCILVYICINIQFI